MMRPLVAITLPVSQWQEIARLLEVSIAELSGYLEASKVEMPVTTNILHEQTAALGLITIALEIPQ